MSTLILTPQGQQRAEDTTGHGAEYSVLSLLYEMGGPTDFDEVVSALHTDEEKASMIVRRLMNQGLVKEV